MQSPIPYVLILVAGVSISACRQADGLVPTPSAEDQSEIGDISRDLQSIAAREAQASADLADDLRKYAEPTSLEPAIDELSRRTASAVAGSVLTGDTAQQLAKNLWVAVVAREMSKSQIESLQDDLTSVLMSAGIEEGRAQPVAAEVEEIQRLVTTRTRRWYEFF